ncbi:MAG: selenocysteine-specific translation elongation factor [Desulfovibrionaceae bacterium]|nr:selenocysteine-specific translation elongation factor [Desulfovibrionaceae bacterium]
MPVVMGTAGHIDHGKTSLIRALTGTDCDRLEEEKRRGITIELGFAQMLLPGGRTLSIVDVPGHEKFVRAMVAGATGVDFVLLAVAATEGVMPQTREHLEICKLLGIRAGIVALTKIDAVDEEMAALAAEDVACLLEGSPLEHAAVIPVSARTGQGLDTLVQGLADLESSFVPTRSQDLFRLPIDRVFTLRGSGTVVTGTMIAGSVSVGDIVELYPSGRRSKVRALQSHGTTVQTAVAGRRTAVNIPDLEVHDIGRGDVVSFPGTLFPSRRWVLELACLASSPRALRHRAEVHFHHGTRELPARLYFVDRDKLQPGEICLAEARFAEPVAGVFGDRCVIRSFSPLRTVAGGVVLNPVGTVGAGIRRRGQGFADYCRRFAPLAEEASAPAAQAGVEKRVLTQLQCTEGAENGLPFELLRVLANLDANALEKVLAALSGDRKISCFDKNLRLYVTDSRLEELAASCMTFVSDYHARNNAMQGVKRSELVSGWGKARAPKLSHCVIERLLKQGRLSMEGEYLRLPDHSAAFSGKDAPLGEAILSAHRQAGMTPPNIAELLESLKISKKEAAPILAALRDAGKLVRVDEGIWYAAEHLKTAEEIVISWFAGHDTLDLADFKSVTGLSRKYMLALLEYFDSRNLTMRNGDVRVLRK